MIGNLKITYKCLISKVMCNTNTLNSQETNTEYKINFPLHCNSSNLIYLLECNTCSLKYVGSTCTPFRTRSDNYKICKCSFNGGSSGVPQADNFRQFASEGHQGFLEDVKVIITDKLIGNGRQEESSWQYQLDNFVPGVSTLGR